MFNKYTLLLLSGIMLFSCNADPKAKAASVNADSTTKNSTPISKVSEDKPATKWTYNSAEDKMTSKMIYGALLEAENPLDLKFPYEGSEAALRVVNRDGKNVVVLEVTKGQFMANAVDNQDIKVRFDSAKAVTYSCAASSDGDSRYLYINPAKKMLEKIRHSKKVIIEAEMYDNGFQQMEFDCDGLVWNH